MLSYLLQNCQTLATPENTFHYIYLQKLSRKVITLTAQTHYHVKLSSKKKKVTHI